MARFEVHELFDRRVVLVDADGDQVVFDVSGPVDSPKMREYLQSVIPATTKTAENAAKALNAQFGGALRRTSPTGRFWRAMDTAPVLVLLEGYLPFISSAVVGEIASASTAKPSRQPKTPGVAKAKKQVVTASQTPQFLSVVDSVDALV